MALNIQRSLKIAAVTAGAAIAGIFYRMGGSGNYPRWVRPAGVSAIAALVLIALGFRNWGLVLFLGLQYGALTTYFKKKDKDAVWWNWALVGLASGLCVVPVVFFNHGPWLGFGIRTIFEVLATMLWSQIIGDAVLEEIGRGALVILSMPLLLI